jgi:hypothetical protein
MRAITTLVPALRGLLALILLCTAFAAPVAAAPARQPGDEIGPVLTLALESSGNGWAWASSAPQRPGTNYLLRIENGRWRIAGDTTTNAALLPSGLSMHSMALTANGTDGWAIGQTIDRTPVLWRFRNGAWRTTPITMPGGAYVPQSLSISADGTKGWLTFYDKALEFTTIMRLRNGQWSPFSQLRNGMINVATISPNGENNIAAGWTGSDQTPALFRLLGDNWVEEPVTRLAPGQIVEDLAMDNSARGWARAGNTLLRISGSNATVAYQTTGEGRLRDMALDQYGRGWAVGFTFLGQEEEPGGFVNKYETLLVRIEGDKAGQVATGSAMFQPGDVAGQSVALTPGGGHAWAGISTGVGFGGVVGFREPWTYGTDGKAPAGAEPLQGRSRCFAEVPYCLRGKFLDVWEKNGGLDTLGLPITTEITEIFAEATSMCVQYTQRARLEEHVEFAGTQHEVLLGLLGNELVYPRVDEEPFKPILQPPTENPNAHVRWFGQTYHTIKQPFLQYWNANGGLRVFGLPRSEAFEEINQADGKTYLVQYFERNRIEYHPENQGTKFEFLLGLLGVEQFKATYGFIP